MNQKIYTCECSKQFTNPQSFNGHKTHCKEHNLIKYGSLENLNNYNKNISLQVKNKYLNLKHNNQIIEQQKLNKWINEQHKCKTCGKIMTEKYGSGRFCSQACANTRIISSNTKNKISNSLKLNKTYNINNHLDYYSNPRKCSVCGNILSYNQRFRSTCSSQCFHIRQQQAGLNSCKVQAEIRRSKNEIYFYELCKNYFKNVENNKQLFYGWDADIIIHDIKVAILWNGIWHYKKVKKQQSLDQIQARDKIKLDNIIKYGYKPYIIKDLGKYNKKFVEKKFNEFINNTGNKYEKENIT